MHRYAKDLIARIRTDYIHEVQERYLSRQQEIAELLKEASPAEAAKLKKLQTKIHDQAIELHSYEEKIHNLADQMIQIDLDDGVKKNYALFETVLAKIK